VLSAAFPELGIGFLGVAFAFGLTVLTMAYAVGHISGGHFNPAVTLGLWSAGRCANHHVVPYIIAQVVGAIVASGFLYVIASGKAGWIPNGFASNGYGDLSPGKYGLGACLLIEVLATFFFLFIIIGTTSKGAAVGFVGIPIGFALVLIPDLDSGDQHLREPGPLDRPGPVRRRRVRGAALAVLAGPDRRGDPGGIRGALALRAGRHGRHGGDREAGRGLTQHRRPISGCPGPALR